MLGPKLWNVFFQDVSLASMSGFKEVQFADDLTCSKNFDADVPNDQILSELVKCQEAVHSWGAKNQIIFDKKKEVFFVFCTQQKARATNFACSARG